MAQISIIQKSDITEAGRFEPDFFLPKFLEKENLLKGIKTISLNECSNFSNGRAYDSGEFSKCGDIYLSKIGDVTNKRNFSVWEKISKNHFYSKNGKYLKHNDILMTLTGDPPDVGKVNLIYSPPKNKLSWNQRVALLRLKQQNFIHSSEFLFIVLSSKYCRENIERHAKGIRQRNVGNDSVREMRIPVLSQPFQLEIEKIVKEAHQKQSQAKDLYAEAENLLLTELDLLDYQPEHQLTFNATKQDIEQAQRFDAEYFQPKYGDIINRIENYSSGFDTIKNIVDWKKGIEVGTGAYTENGKDFVRVSNVSINGVEKANRKISDALFAEIKNTFQPKQGEILFTKDGTIGISYLLKENIEGVLSSAFLRLTLKDKYNNFEKEHLTLILNSVICKAQIGQLSGGAIIAHLKPSDFEKFKVPLINTKAQTQIAEKITLSHQLRAESKALLELAKTKVEQEIEK